MKKFLVLAIIFCLLIVACDSGGGDDLPKLSEAPELQLRAMGCTMQGILEIISQIEINGSYPNVVVNDNSALCTNAVVDVIFDYDNYEVTFSGTIIVSSDGSKVTFDVTMSRCESYFEFLYCTFHIEAKKKSNGYKYTKVILNGIEYEYDL